MDIHTLLVVQLQQNHLLKVKCDRVDGKFAYTINMYCEIVLNSS